MEPVFGSIQGAMDPEVYRQLHPDWRLSQRAAVEAAWSSRDVEVWVARSESQVVGFVAAKIHEKGTLGEIYMIAVDPGFQRRGIATALTEHALSWFKQAGVSVVMVETGGDPGHAPARRAYQSAGFRPFPIARYFRRI